MRVLIPFLKYKILALYRFVYSFLKLRTQVIKDYLQLFISAFVPHTCTYAQTKHKPSETTQKLLFRLSHIFSFFKF